MRPTVDSITSRSNPLIARVRRLERDKAFRRETGLYLCDGKKLYAEAVHWNAPVDTVLFTPGQQPEILCPNVRYVQVPEGVMEAVSPAKTPQGLLFLCRTPEPAPPKALDGNRYLVLDGLQDPGNVGTIWRTADAFGADGLLLTHHCADPWHWKTVRATMGAAFRLPVWEVEAEELAPLLEASGLPLYGTALRADTVDIRQLEPGRAAVVIGNEGQGISPELLALCSQTLKIPMEAKCESLNAAAAAAVVLWELYRR
ncbi:MAG: RNA methyltransferase [Clostridiales bacterium]|nr:RNA methyltransferase [Clostridiales bacterium]